jgi:hypothetical protein
MGLAAAQDPLVPSFLYSRKIFLRGEPTFSSDGTVNVVLVVFTMADEVRFQQSGAGKRPRSRACWPPREAGHTYCPQCTETCKKNSVKHRKKKSERCRLLFRLKKNSQKAAVFFEKYLQFCQGMYKSQKIRS